MLLERSTIHITIRRLHRLQVVQDYQAVQLLVLLSVLYSFYVAVLVVVQKLPVTGKQGTCGLNTEHILPFFDYLPDPPFFAIDLLKNFSLNKFLLRFLALFYENFQVLIKCCVKKKHHSVSFHGKESNGITNF